MIPVVEGVFITVILGSSLVVTKFALRFWGPLTLLGSRYMLAFVVLLPLLLKREGLPKYTRKTWTHLLLLAGLFHVIGNGTLFVGLRYVPATTASFLLSLVPIVVLLLGLVFLRELPTLIQLVGLIVAIVGSTIFLWSKINPNEIIGLFIIGSGLVGIATFAIIGRKVSKEQLASTLALTTVPLGLAGAVVLIAALLLEPIPLLTLDSVVPVVILAIVHTALIYFLYNHALRKLEAFKMSVILNLTPMFTALWSWVLLGIAASSTQLIGIGVMICGVSLVQVRKAYTVCK